MGVVNGAHGLQFSLLLCIRSHCWESSSCSHPAMDMRLLCWETCLLGERSSGVHEDLCRRCFPELQQKHSLCFCLFPQDTKTLGTAQYHPLDHRDGMGWVLDRIQFLVTSVQFSSFAQLCLTLCNSMNCIVHGILQARILDWVAVPFSRGSFQPRNQTKVSYIAGGFFTN